MPATTTKVSFGDAGYTILRDKWIQEGRPNGTFERFSEAGGELWRVRSSIAIDYPDFYLKAAAGPTDPGNDKDPEWDWASQTHGYIVEMNDTGMTVVEGPGGEGDLHFGMEPFPLDEGVWSP
jgi:hypothetical protein